MNENAARWQLTNPKSRALESAAGQVTKRAEVYARIWGRLREIFREAGASNVKFLFAPLSHTGNYKDSSREPVRVTLEALRRIPASQVDIIGLNVYATAYSTPEQLRDHTFESLSDGWIRWLRAVPGMETKPLAIGEMGIGRTNSSTGVPNSETHRIQWIREAYASSKKMGFSLSTYFNRDKWACVQETCRKVLGDSIRSFQEP
jgi:beta-mannanase